MNTNEQASRVTRFLMAAGLLLCLSFLSPTMTAALEEDPKSGSNNEVGKTEKETADALSRPDADLLKMIEKERIKQLKKKGKLRVTQPENTEQDKQFLKRLQEQRRHAIEMRHRELCQEIQKVVDAGIGAFLTECTKRKPSSERLIKWCTKRWNDRLPNWNKALAKCK